MGWGGLGWCAYGYGMAWASYGMVRIRVDLVVGMPSGQQIALDVYEIEMHEAVVRKDTAQLVIRKFQSLWGGVGWAEKDSAQLDTRWPVPGAGGWGGVGWGGAGWGRLGLGQAGLD